MKLSKTKKRLLAVIAFVLIAAIAWGAYTYSQHRLYACMYAKAFSYAQVEAQTKPVLVAHRGIASLAPENTLPAYEKAAAAGFTYAETDIHATADGVWVLSHDASLKRMTGYRGIIEQMKLDEVLAHPVTKGGHVKDYESIDTPTLEAFLRLCREQNIAPVLEIKTAVSIYPNAPYKAILELLEQYGLKDKAVIIDFEYEALELLREYDKEIAMQYLLKTLDQAAITKAEQLGNCGIDCEYKALLKAPELVQQCKKIGMPVNAWTVDSAAAAQALCALGVDFITTNAARP